VPSNTSSSPPDWGIEEAAVYLGVSNYTIRRMIARGELPAYRVGKLIRLRRSEIDGALPRIGA
jgi:excisionase family DNA binding protein